MREWIIFYIGILAAVSIVAFFFYGIDKHRARKGEWRIQEALLLGLGFCGGSVGSLLGMKLFHHKTKHWYFWAVNILGLIWQLGLLFYLCFFGR